MKKTAKILIIVVLICIALSTLIACGGGDTYKVEFIVDGEVYHTEYVTGNDVIPFPENAPSKTDHIFMGWYADEGEWQDAVTASRFFTNKISSDLKVYARFIENPQHVHDYHATQVDATCEGKGYTLYTCSCGDNYKEDEVPALGHEYTNYLSDGNATCESDGTKTAQCNNGCGETDTITDKGSMLIHEYGTYTYNNDARCEVDGTETAKCIHCEAPHTKTAVGTALEHEYTNYLSDGNATCESDGTKTAECNNGCGETYTITDEGSMLIHEYGTYTYNNDARCEVDGTETAKCIHCEAPHTKTAVGTALEHVYTNYVSDGNATCYEDGTKTAECDNGCGKTDTITDEGTMLPSSIEFSDSLSLTGANAYGLRVRSAVDEIDFTQYVTVEGDSSYTVASDKYATTPYLEKIAPLSFGDNVFYIFSKVKGVSTTYTLTVYRNKIFTVTFETDGGSEIDHQSIEEGYCALEPDVEPEKEWCEFLGWDFDFTTPITEETIITAQWEWLREVVTLYLTAEEDKGWIEEVIAKYNTQNDQYAIVLDVGTMAIFEQKVLDKDDTVSDLCYGATSGIAEYRLTKDYFVELSDVYNSPFNDDYTIAEAMIDYVRRDSYDIGSNWAKGYYDIRTEMLATSLIVNKTLVNYYEGLPMWGVTKKLSEVTTITELNAWIDRMSTLSESYPYTYKDASGTGIVSGYAYSAYTGGYFETLWQTMWAQYSGVEKYREFFKYDLDYDMYDDIGRQYAYQGIKDIDLISREIDGAVGMDYDQAIDAFLAGKTAFMIGYSDVYARAKDKLTQYGTEIEMIYLPTVDGGVYSNLLYCDTGDGFVIPNVEGVNVDGAKDFLKYMFRVENGPTVLAKETGMTMPFDGVDGDDTYMDALINEGIVPEFGQSVYALIKGANGIVTPHPTTQTNNEQLIEYLLDDYLRDSGGWVYTSRQYVENLASGHWTPESCHARETDWAQSRDNELEIIKAKLYGLNCGLYYKTDGVLYFYNASDESETPVT